MKPNLDHLESFRVETGPYASRKGDLSGAFRIRRGTLTIVVIFTSGDSFVKWEHASARVDTYKGQRTPTWEEMCFIKDQFWTDEECVVQYHPARSEYGNCHPHVLHLWRPLGLDLPTPPKIAV